MKRKVIKQGNGTLTITLPKDWTEKVGLKGGDEIEIDSEGQKIVVSFNGEKQKASINIDSKNIKSERAFKWLFAALYKSGYDEIELSYEDQKLTPKIQNYINEYYVGFAIMKQNKNSVIMRSISKDEYSELEPSLRRAFLVSLSMSESILAMMKSNDMKNIGDLLILEKSNNQFTNFCERLLVKKGYTVPDKVCFKYLIIWNIESVCDCLRDLCAYIDENNINKISPEITDMFAKITLFFRDFYNHIYNYSMEELDRLHSEQKIIMNHLKNCKTYNKSKIEMIYIFRMILERMMDFSGSLIALNLTQDS